VLYCCKFVYWNAMSRNFLDRHGDGRFERLTTFVTPVDQLSRTEIGHATDFVRQWNDLGILRCTCTSDGCLSPRSPEDTWRVQRYVTSSKRKRSVRIIARRDTILISLLSSLFFLLSLPPSVNLTTSLQYSLHSQRHNLTT
jgi:hypothetical protein